VQDRGPMFAVFEIKPRLRLIAGGNPDIVARATGAGFYHGVIGIGVGDSSLPAFLDNFERRLIVDPIGLVLEEVAVGPKKIQGSIGFGWVRMGSIGCAAHKADRAAGESPVTGETNARVVIADVCRSDSAYASSAVNVPSRAGQAS